MTRHSEIDPAPSAVRMEEALTDHSRETPFPRKALGWFVVHPGVVRLAVQLLHSGKVGRALASAKRIAVLSTIVGSYFGSLNLSTQQLVGQAIQRAICKRVNSSAICYDPLVL